MIDFEEELKHYQPKKDIADAEEEIHSQELTDFLDLLKEMKTETAPEDPTRAGGRKV